MTNSKALTLNSISVPTGNLTVNATGGFSQVGNATLTVGGTSTFNGSNGTITLDQTNTFNGPVSSGNDEHPAPNNGSPCSYTGNLVLGTANIAAGNLRSDHDGEHHASGQHHADRRCWTSSFNATSGVITLT